MPAGCARYEYVCGLNTRTELNIETIKKDIKAVVDRYNLLTSQINSLTQVLDEVNDDLIALNAVVEALHAPPPPP